MNNAILITASILSVISLVVSITAVVLVLAKHYSTHTIQWKEMEFDKFTDEEDKEEDKFDDMLEKALSMQKKKKREQDPLEYLEETSNF